MKAKKAPAKKPALKTKKPAAKAAPVMAKTSKKLEPKVKLAVESKKGDKKSEKLEIKATEVTATENTEEEEEELAVAGSASESGLAIAAAAAGADTAAGSLKNFRHHPDIENFYRFIFENDLRYEALEIIDVIVSQRTTHKAVKAAKARPN